MRSARFACLVGLLLASCSISGSSPTSLETTSAASVSTSAVTSTEPTSTTASTGTTAATTTTASTGTTAATTSTTSAVVLTGPGVPDARSAGEVPWDQVGPGWHVVLYDASSEPTGDGNWQRPVMLYLVGPDSTLYQVAAWPAGEYRTTIADVAGTRVLVVGGSDSGELVSEIVDMKEGSTTPVLSWPMGSPGPWPPAGLTHPTGKNLIVWQSNDTREWLEREAPDGTKLARLYEQSSTEWPDQLSWLYRYDGSMVLVGHTGGMALVRVGGELFRELSLPEGMVCRPVRWWGRTTVLTQCVEDDPMTYYSQLWLVSTEGLPAEALTAQAENPEVVDFGFVDAWPTPTVTLLQWTGDCGASALEALQPDGTGVWLDTSWMTDIDGYRLVDVVHGEATIFTYRGCDASEGMLDEVGLDGSLERHLVERVDDARGVMDAAGFATVYP